MIKKISVYFLVFIVLFFAGFNLHAFFLKQLSYTLQFNLWNVYVFNALFSGLLCFFFLVYKKIKKTSSNIGFLYMGTLFLKIICFFILFENSIFNLNTISKIESSSLLISLAVFLIPEVYFISEILNEKEA